LFVQKEKYIYGEGEGVAGGVTITAGGNSIIWSSLLESAHIIS